MTPAQFRMAKGALKLGLIEIAERAKVSTQTLVRLERGERLQERTLAVIQRAFEDAGVEFTNGDEPGVKLKRPARRTKAPKR